MLRRFLYLDESATNDYLSALEGGLRSELQQRSKRSGKGSGNMDVKVMKAGGERAHEDEESVTLSDTIESRFDRLVSLTEAQPDLSGWVEVLEVERDLPMLGIGAIISLECDIYIPDFVRAMRDMPQALDQLDAMMPLAETFGFDLSGLPPKDQLGGMRSMLGQVNANSVVIGDLDDTEWRIAGEVLPEFIRSDLEGRANVVGKVSRRLDAGHWKPLLALPGMSLVPRSKRRELERQRPTPETESQYLEGPALVLDILSIHR